MDFTLKNPLHLFTFLILGTTCALLFLSPILTLFNLYPSPLDVQYNEAILIFSSIIIIFLLIGTPLIWYALVNNFSPKKILEHLQIDTKHITNAVFWSIIAIAIMYAILFIIGIALTVIGYETNEITNIEELANNLSLGSIIFIVLFQSTSEEIFFRGFLFDKFNTLGGPYTAILATSMLFGIAHLSYGKLYPAIMTLIFGIVLGIIVIKSKNLLSAILTHVIYNGTSFIIFFIAQTYNLQAIIL